MARRSSPWSALRPVIFAGAAAVTWLTLSSTAASADAGPDSSSLLGSVTTPVSALTHNLVDPITPAPDGPTTNVAAPGLAQPVAAQVSGLADGLIASVPVVGQVVPAGTVSTVSAPLADAADGVTAGVVEAVATPVTEAAPVLEPVLKPVADLLTGTDQLPLPLPDAPLAAVPAELPVANAPASAETTPAAQATNPTSLQTVPEVAQADLSAETSAGAKGGPALEGTAPRADTAAPRADVSGPSGAASEEPAGPAGRSPLPSQAPVAPTSGTGAGGSSGGPSGAAAWLSPFDFHFEHPGTVPAGHASEQAPAPVSFDPGSSPD